MWRGVYGNLGQMPATRNETTSDKSLKEVHQRSSSTKGVGKFGLASRRQVWVRSPHFWLARAMTPCPPIYSFESAKTTGVWLDPDTCSRYTVHGIVWSMVPAWRVRRLVFSDGERPDNNTDGPEERPLEEI